MRFKRSCSLGVAAAIGMSVLAGAAAAKEMTTGLSFDFNRNDSGFTPIFSDCPNEHGVEEFYEFRPGEYEFNEMETRVIARTDEAGTAYLMIGTDSGFEGVTSYYLDDISVSWADTSEVSVTRGDAVKMLFDHAHRWDEIVGTPTFTDVAWDAPYAEAVAWAEQNGYLGGYGNGFFGPEDAMTVEQAMVMIYRLFGSPKVTDADILDRYQDGGQVSPWARDAVAFAISNKLLEPGDAIQPQSPITMKALRYAIGQIGMAD